MTLMKNSLLRVALGAEEDGEEGVKDLIDITVRKMDSDKDGRISYADFFASVEREPLMLEVKQPRMSRVTHGHVGQCLV